MPHAITRNTIKKMEYFLRECVLFLRKNRFGTKNVAKYRRLFADSVEIARSRFGFEEQWLLGDIRDCLRSFFLCFSDLILIV